MSRDEGVMPGTEGTPEDPLTVDAEDELFRREVFPGTETVDPPVVDVPPAAPRDLPPDPLAPDAGIVDVPPVDTIDTLPPLDEPVQRKKTTRKKSTGRKKTTRKKSTGRKKSTARK